MVVHIHMEEQAVDRRVLEVEMPGTDDECLRSIDGQRSNDGLC